MFQFDQAFKLFILANILIESKPEDNNNPTGTSDISCRSTALTISFEDQMFLNLDLIKSLE